MKHRDTYRVEGISTDVVLELRYGQAITPLRMDAVSNSPATLVRFSCLDRLWGCHFLLSRC